MRKHCKRIQITLLTLALLVVAGGSLWAQKEKSSEAAATVKPKACVIDMDGTIADETARRAKAEAEHPKEKDKNAYYRAYFTPEWIVMDKPIEKSREVLDWLSAQGIDIYYVSSRSQGCLKASIKWIEENKFPKGKWVYHRKAFQRTVDFKTGAVKEIQEKADVLFGVGDRDSDIEAYKKCGIKAIKVKANSNKDWERVKTEIEKILAKKK
jgi:phosphoglycolate phosphatase-like HAD superfamily hydrolase